MRDRVASPVVTKMRFPMTKPRLDGRGGFFLSESKSMKTAHEFWGDWGRVGRFDGVGPTPELDRRALARVGSPLSKTHPPCDTALLIHYSTGPLLWRADTASSKR